MTGHGVTRALGSGSRASDRRSAAQSDGRKLIGIKGTHYLHARMREACRADGMTSAELISELLDMRERAIARRVAAGNPLAGALS